MIIDSHVHLWVIDGKNYPWQPIGGYIPENEAPLSQFLEIINCNGIYGAVLIQPTPYGWDNSYLIHCKQTNPNIFKAVVLVNPLSENAAENLTALFEHGADGLRINLHLNSLSTWSSQHFHRLLAQCVRLNCPVCLQLTPEYFPVLEEICAKYQTKFIIDHLGRPAPGSSINHHQLKKLLEFSIYPNVYVKLSGMNYYSKQSAPYPDTWDLLMAIKENFTAKRCLWGSDYPFVEEHWSYTKLLNVIRKELNFSEYDLDWILFKTAKSLWWDS